MSLLSLKGASSGKGKDMKAFFAMAAAMMISVLGCHTAQAAEALGTLTMDNDNGDRECSIPIERGYYYYKMADTQCKNDEATKFKLSGVVAGVEIRFCGGDNCKSRMRTVNGLRKMHASATR